MGMPNASNKRKLKGLAGPYCHFPRFLASCEAVVTVEFGVLLPLLLLLFFGAIELARLQFTHIMIERVVFDTALEIKLNYGNVELNNVLAKYVQSKLEPLASADSLTVSAKSAESMLDINGSAASGTGDGGDVVRLQVTASLAFLDWLRPDTFSTQKTYVYYFVNEAEETTYLDD